MTNGGYVIFDCTGITLSPGETGSDPIPGIFERAKKAVATKKPILLVGESGGDPFVGFAQFASVSSGDVQIGVSYPQNFMLDIDPQDGWQTI